MNNTQLVNTPQITLIVPVYNVKNYVYQCLNCIIGQTYQNLEILIIDDGSTDGCSEICDNFALRDSRITVFHTNNRGLASARNHGLDNMSMKSEYVMFLDSDDWMERNTVERLFREIDSSQADLVACPYYFEKKDSRKQAYDVSHRTLLYDNEIIKHYLRESDIGRVVWNKIYRTSLFSDTRFPDGRIFEDIFTMCRLIMAAKKVLIIPDVLFHYRIRECSLSRDYSIKSLIDYWDANIEQYKILSDMVDQDYKNILVGSCLLAINRMWLCYGGLNKSEKKAVASTVDEMEDFIYIYKGVVLRSEKFTARHKIICIIASSRRNFHMQFINKIFKLLLCIKGKNSYV